MKVSWYHAAVVAILVVLTVVPLSLFAQGTRQIVCPAQMENQRLLYAAVSSETGQVTCVYAKVVGVEKIVKKGRLARKA